MGISSIGKMDYAGGQMAANRPADVVSKNIKDKISDAQRQKQTLTSKAGIPAEEKRKKRLELQQEISSLNVKLKQREDAVDKEQKREETVEKTSADSKAADAKNADKKTVDAKTADNKAVRNERAAMRSSDGRVIKLSGPDDGTSKGIAANEDKAKQREEIINIDTKAREAKEKERTAEAAKEKKERREKAAGLDEKDVRSIVTANNAMEQNRQQYNVVTRMEDGIVVLKGEIKQDEIRGVDTDKKREKLEGLERKRNQGFPPRFPEESKEDKVARDKKTQNITVNMSKNNGSDPAVTNYFAKLPEVSIFN